MSSILQVQHITLMQIHKPGWATFIIAHKSLTERGHVFRHKGLNGIAVGKYIVVSFRSTPNRRAFVSVLSEISATGSNPVEVFLNGANIFDRLISANTKCVNNFGSGWDDYEQIGKYKTWMNDGSYPNLSIVHVDEQQDERLTASVTFTTAPAEKNKPNWLNGFYITHKQRRAFDASLKLANAGSYANILLVGPSGFGKTSIPQAYADANGMDYHRINCAQVRDPNEFFGYREAVSGDTIFDPSEFSKAAMKGNCVIVLDELNRLEPWLHNALFPMLDDARKTIIHEFEIEVGENVIFVATINEGYAFTGTFELDQALRNRMDVTLTVGSLPSEIETEIVQRRTNLSKEQSSHVIDLIKRARRVKKDNELQIDVSTRTSLKVAKLITAGCNFADAISFAITNNLEGEEAKEMVDALMPLIIELDSK